MHFPTGFLPPGNAVDPPGQQIILRRVLANEIANHDLDFLQQLTLLGDKFRIGGAAKQYRALADLARALDLDPMLSGIFPKGADDPRAAVVDGVISCAGEIEPAFRFMDRKRVALLIQAVGGNGNWCGTPLRRHAVQFKTFMVERRQDGRRGRQGGNTATRIR